MDSITFTDNETKYFGDLFTHLDSEGVGKVPVNQAQEFLRASKLSAEVLSQMVRSCANPSAICSSPSLRHSTIFTGSPTLPFVPALPSECMEISNLSGGASQGWYGRRELFVALKLVAAAQRGLPVCTESLSLGVDLPLPRLHTNNNTHFADDNALYTTKGNCASSPDLIQLSDSDCNTSQMVDGGYRMMESEEGDGVDDNMSDPSGRTATISPAVSSPASDSPTPTNSVHEKNWGQSHSHWQGLINDEHRQLLGTEEESSDRHSSDESEECDVWSITEEQRLYYTEQFRSMQSDLSKLLSGTVAKEFFEKSKLPVNELSKIWQLSDVSRDGALSLEEFFTAMHLVVLRRNNIDLPETLPPSLMPTDHARRRKSSSSGIDGGNSGASGSSSSMTAAPGSTSFQEQEHNTSKPTPEPLSPSRGKEWTKFVDSPTSTVSSPGLKPVNFDFQKAAVEQDPKILHPKPVRLTPESKRLEAPETENSTANLSPDPIANTAPSMPDPVQLLGDVKWSPKKSQEDADVKAIQRPLPRKPAGSGVVGLPPPPQSLGTPPDDQSLYGPTSLPMMPSLPASSLPGKKDPPPPPPPRPSKTHTRSSSLDLNKFSKSGFLGAPPAVPPRASPGASSPKKLVYQKSDGDMSSVTTESLVTGPEDLLTVGRSMHPSASAAHLDTTTASSTSSSSSSANRPPTMEHARNSAFEVYRKPHGEQSSAFERVTGRVEEDDRNKQSTTGARPKDKRELQASIRTTKEKNKILTRLNSELNQELAEVMEERIALELQLEQMKLFSS
ncbi:RALBP1 associated Eps domain containing isoform X2 [Oratosquilla oratoria]|uniref:RALBP1 associated Eps domain containing isoform X2 n=1 Tax=Oratosquilla oratoria TaxID=337810 RepID=UPI003F766314